MIFIILSPILFILIKFLAYFIIEKKELVPEFLNYKPFNCVQCCSFWTNLIVSIASTYFITPWLFPWIVITVLDAIAYLIDKKNNTENVYIDKK